MVYTIISSKRSIFDCTIESMSTWNFHKDLLHIRLDEPVPSFRLPSEQGPAVTLCQFNASSACRGELIEVKSSTNLTSSSFINLVTTVSPCALPQTLFESQALRLRVGSSWLKNISCHSSFAGLNFISFIWAAQYTQPGFSTGI
jgi:hypothetical protein